MTDKERIAELETQLENARRLLQISDGRAARLSGKVDELEARLREWDDENTRLEIEKRNLEARLAEANARADAERDWAKKRPPLLRRANHLDRCEIMLKESEVHLKVVY